MANAELLERTLVHIRENPELWDQDVWIQGDRACFAGRACLLSGLKIAAKAQGGSYVRKAGTEAPIIHVLEAAGQLLDLDKMTAFRLSSLPTELDRLSEFVWRLINPLEMSLR